MSHHGRRDSGDERPQNDASAAESAGAFLRALARRADADPAFAAQMLAALDESGLKSASDEAQRASTPTRTKGSRTRASTRATPGAPATNETPAPDPFTIYRAQGEERLRATLDELDLATLRAIVRAHRFDPARISARWTARERVIALIVDQVKARANHGRAFERI